METDYSDYGCPQKNTVDSKGHCSKAIPNIPGDQGCSAYCEIRLIRKYGKEVPLPGATCEANSSCSVSGSKSLTITNTYTFSIDGTGGAGTEASKVFTAAFNLGASYSYSESVSYSQSVTHTSSPNPLGPNQCGYFTFIPYLMESCGTLTRSAEQTTPAGYLNSGLVTSCDKSSYTDTLNWCNTTPYKPADDRAAGEIHFIFTDCASGGVLRNGQVAAYEYPGVSCAANRVG